MTRIKINIDTTQGDSADDKVKIENEEDGSKHDQSKEKSMKDVDDDYQQLKPELPELKSTESPDKLASGII